jgi:predicted Ser/Thr protein kinase
MDEHVLESNSRWKEGIRCFDEGNIEAALKHFFEVDMCPRIAFNVGILEMKLEQIEDAKAAFGQALKLDPNFTLAYLQLGICHFVLGEILDAQTNFSCALESTRNKKKIDYVHVMIDSELLAEKLKYNLGLCNGTKKDSIPFGAPHRLYLPPTTPQVSNSKPVDPAGGKSKEARPRSQSDRTEDHYHTPDPPRENRKFRANSLGEMWERLFHSKNRKNKKLKKKIGRDESVQETMYSPINPDISRFKISRFYSSSETELFRPTTTVVESNNIDFKEIQLGEEIGRGSFGSVFSARWRGAECCCKMPRIGKAQDNLTTEIDHMRKLMHPNVCQFLGIVKEPLCLVMELMREGSVINLMKNRAITMDASVVISIAKQASCGMLYLHSKGILHGDLAARNLLFRTEINGNSLKYHIKITDFGLSAVLSDDDTSDTQALSYPIRWSAPELLQDRKMSRASDSWSFGVLLWELLERDQPYRDMTAQEVVTRVIKGFRLPRPSRIHYPMELNQLMDKCWFPDPDIRPDFSAIEMTLEIVENMTGNMPTVRPIPPSTCRGCAHRIESDDRFCRFCGFQTC